MLLGLSDLQRVSVYIIEWAFGWKGISYDRRYTTGFHTSQTSPALSIAPACSSTVRIARRSCLVEST